MYHLTMWWSFIGHLNNMWHASGKSFLQACFSISAANCRFSRAQCCNFWQMVQLLGGCTVVCVQKCGPQIAPSVCWKSTIVVRGNGAAQNCTSLRWNHSSMVKTHRSSGYCAVAHLSWSLWTSLAYSLSVRQGRSQVAMPTALDHTNAVHLKR